MKGRHPRLLLVTTALMVFLLTAGFTTPGGPDAQATPAPAQASTSAETAFPWLGLLVLLAPAAAISWLKGRSGHKDERIRASCCLPVIDANDRPFQIVEEE